MNYCPNCGRPLADGEVCNCNQNAQQIPPPQPTSSPFPDPAQTGSSPYMDQPGGFDPYGTPVQNTQQGTPPPQGYYQNPQQNYYQNPQGQPYQNQQPGPGYQYQYQPGVQPPQKKGPNGCLIAALICIPIFLVIAAVLVAIIVPAMIGYTKKAKSASANALAKQLYNAAMTAAVDLDSQGVNMAGYFICGEFSDGVTEVNLTEFRETMETYLDEDFDCTYFVVVEDGSCTYACIQTEDGDYGTYPLTSAPREVMLYTGDSVEADECDLSDVYNNAKTNYGYDFSYDDDFDDYLDDYDWENFDWDDYDSEDFDWENWYYDDDAEEWRYDDSGQAPTNGNSVNPTDETVPLDTRGAAAA